MGGVRCVEEACAGVVCRRCGDGVGGSTKHKGTQ